MSESTHSADDFLSNDSADSNSEGSVTKKPRVTKVEKKVALCRFCQQNVFDPNTKFFKCLPEPALEEEAALTDERLLLYNEGELIPEVDMKPLHKITRFTVFDVEGHLCPFDSGLIESNKELFFSGYIKPIYDEDPRPVNGVPTQELGPIEEWWISGFDGGNSFIIGFSTPCAEYILMQPTSDYSYFMREPKQKALLAKIVIEFLGKSNTPTYEELVNRIDEVSVPEDIEPLDKNCIRKHAQFIIDQVREVDDKKKLISTPAAQDIIRMFGVNFRTQGTRKKFQLRKRRNPKTTPLVREVFKFFFDSGLIINNPECKKQTADSCSPPPPPPPPLPPPPPPPTLHAGFPQHRFSWDEGSDFAVVNYVKFYVGNYVSMNTKWGKPNRIFRIEYFFQQNFTKQAHCTELIKGTDTILGNAGHPREFFFLEECSDWPICKIKSKVDIEVVNVPKEWKDFISYRAEPPPGVFFVRKTYFQRHGVFEDIKDGKPGVCGVCRRREESKKAEVPIPVKGSPGEAGVTIYKEIMWRNELYTPGCCVFLEPFSVVFDAQKSSRKIEKTSVTVKMDEVIYPEFYRKAKDAPVSEDCPEPFVVALIKNIFSRSEGPHRKLFLTVTKFYRPENTRAVSAFDERSLDPQLLFWSKEEAEVMFDHVRGKCDVVFSQTPPPSPECRPKFYFNSAFDSASETFVETEPIPLKRTERDFRDVTKLKTLNLFSGCGGLAEGLRQSGVAEILWAVENDSSTCRAFKSNFPDALMFEKDCNLFLKEVISGKVSDENGVRYPERGEVEFLCGGPPCQGFSTMNRFSAKEESQNNNSLILTFISFCDFYRPKFILLENVRNFASYKKSIFLKHALSCLVMMGYQCSFGVIQAGNYGVPQTRRRLFILAAAPGFALPDFPEPTHVFYGSLKNFEHEVNGVNFCCRIRNNFSGSAPYRHMTIWDAVSDLFPMSESNKSQSRRVTTPYVTLLGGQPTELRDHVSKEMSPINEARIKNVPASQGCDWRDLPNIKVKLRDGTLTEVLKYAHHDRKNGKSRSGLLRGVCRCSSGWPCDLADRQNNTLIPWFLAHTANRNNNWSGLYGRLDWQGVFNTVTTNPEPSGQQGKVLHPAEDRVISVRECARAQGLPDSLKLFGTVAEKYRQVGNAVPTPVARALGYEIKESLISGGSKF